MAVGEPRAQAVQVGGVGGGCFQEVFRGKGLVGAQGLSKEADPSGDFRVWASGCLLADVVKCLYQGLVVGAGGLVANRDAGGGCEELGFGEVDVDAKGGADAPEELEEGDDVIGVQEGVGVVDVGVSVGLGALAVVPLVACSKPGVAIRGAMSHLNLWRARQPPTGPRGQPAYSTYTTCIVRTTTRLVFQLLV